MRIVFMGTPEFAVPSLERLHAEHDVAAVITAPDKPAGRGKKLSESAVKKTALKLGIPVWQPTNLKDQGFLDSLKSLEAEVFVVVAFRMLPDAVWQMPPKGTINLHASLLPQYRGAAPINRAVMRGETTTGLTTFFIRKEIDTGGIIDRTELAIGENETAEELHDRMMVEGSKLLADTLASLEKGTVRAIPQESLMDVPITSAPKIFREDRRIDWSKTAGEVHNHIRGLSPYPGAFATDKSGVEIKILRSAKIEENLPSIGKPGKVHIDGERMFVQTGTRPVEILRFQLPGKKPVDTPDGIRGMRNREELDFS